MHLYSHSIAHQHAIKINAWQHVEDAGWCTSLKGWDNCERDSLSLLDRLWSADGGGCLNEVRLCEKRKIWMSRRWFHLLQLDKLRIKSGFTTFALSKGFITLWNKQWMHFLAARSDLLKPCKVSRDIRESLHQTTTTFRQIIHTTFQLVRFRDASMHHGMTVLSLSQLLSREQSVRPIL